MPDDTPDRNKPVPGSEAARDAPAPNAGPGVSLSRSERQDIVDRMKALEGPRHGFVAEIARQATDARGRVDDDVYGIIRVTLQALAEAGGRPPPLVFAVTHHQTGEVRQVGFLPTGAERISPGGRFVTNDPRFGTRELPGSRGARPGGPRRLPGPADEGGPDGGR